MFWRAAFADEFTRRILLVRGDDCVSIFDELGALLDEPENGTPMGKQLLDGEDGFLAEWRDEGYYRLAPAPWR